MKRILQKAWPVIDTLGTIVVTIIILAASFAGLLIPLIVYLLKWHIQ